MRRLFCCVTVVAVAISLAGRTEDQLVVADGFDYPVAKPDGSGYRRDTEFGDTCKGCGKNGTDLRGHLGEDWNKGQGNDDLGEPVFAAAHGRIIYAQNAGEGWGNVVIIRHLLSDNQEVESFYAHLDEILVSRDSHVSRGDKIGTIGRGWYDPEKRRWDYSAHLHFEIRTVINKGLGPGYDRRASGPNCAPDFNGWTCPSRFIDEHPVRDVTATPGFSLEAFPNSQTIVQGEAATFSVTVQSLDGFDGVVVLSAPELPDGRSVPGTGWSTSTVIPPKNGTADSVFTLITDAQTSARTFSLIFEGRNAGVVRSATASVTVNPISGADFSMDVSPTSRTVAQGEAASYTVTVRSENGFSSPVDFYALNVPGNRVNSGTEWSPARVTPPPNGTATTTFTLATDNQTPTGSFTMTLEARGAGKTRSKNVLAMVNASAPVVHFSNLGPGDSADFGGWHSLDDRFVGVSGDAASAFTSLITGEVRQIELMLQAPLAGGPVPIGDPRYVTVWLMNDAGNRPGDVLESFGYTFATGTAQPQLIKFDSLQRPLLQRGAQYWIGASAQTPASIGTEVLWMFSPNDIGSRSFRTDENGAWGSASTGRRAAFRITGSIR